MGTKKMDRLTHLLKLACCLALVSGCSITGSINGTWRTVSVDPPGAPFPVDAITFDQNQNYTASWAQAGKTRTTLGQYRWSGSRLEVVRPGNQPQTYKASIGLDGRLTMTYGAGESKIEAKLERGKP